MNKAEIQNLVKELSAYDSNYDNYIMTEQDISILADELLAKINYTRCCEELCDETENNRKNSSIATYTENSKPEHYA